MNGRVSDETPTEPEDDGASQRLVPPKALGGPGPAAQVATVAVAIVVLLVVGIVLAVQDADAPPKPGAAEPSSVATAPTVPPSVQDATTSNSVLAPPELTDVPSLLCPSLTVSHPLVVVSFNIHSAQDGNRTDLGRITQELRAWKADVVLLQEVDSGRRGTGFVEQARALAEALDMSWVYGPNQQRPDGGPIGNAVLTKFPIKSSGNIRLPLAGGKQHRGLLHAVLDVEGNEVSVYSTHFDHISGRARVAQARVAAQQVTRDDRPTILGGDLNAPAGSAPLQVLRAAGLGDAWAVGEGSGLTAPAHRPRSRIDFLLHDAWIVPKQAVVLASSVSDHRAVWARMELREEVDCIEVGG